MAILEIENICKSFGRTEVLKSVSFSLEQGQVLSLIGSSGSGKTTLLRCLNFLEQPDLFTLKRTLFYRKFIILLSYFLPGTYTFSPKI